MSRRTWITVTVVGLTLSIFLMRFTSNQRETLDNHSVKSGLPEFEGKAIEFWTDRLKFIAVNSRGEEQQTGFPEIFQQLEPMEKYLKSVKAIRDRAPMAIRSMGSSALPYLLKRVVETEAEAKLHPLVLDLPLGASVENSGKVRRGQAIAALVELSDLKQSFLPQLIGFVRNTNAEDAARGAAIGVIKLVDEEKARSLVQK